MAYLTNTDSMLAVWNKGCMRNVSSFIIFHRTGNTFDRPTSTRVSAPQCWCFIHQQHRVETRLNETWYFHHDYYVVYYMKYFRAICGSSDVAVTETNSLACTLSDRLSSKAFMVFHSVEHTKSERRICLKRTERLQTDFDLFWSYT